MINIDLSKPNRKHDKALLFLLETPVSPGWPCQRAVTSGHRREH